MYIMYTHIDTASSMLLTPNSSSTISAYTQFA